MSHRLGRPRALAVAFVLAALLPGTAVAGSRGKRKSGSNHEASSRSRSRPAEVQLKGGEDVPTAAAGAQASSAPSGAPPSRGPTRIDFDDRLIQGQTNKSGAVYLYERKELKVRSMVKKRESFRDEIVSSVYDD